MSSVINTNMSSLYAQKSLAYAQSELINSVQKLSSGQRVSNTLDDSSGLALAVSIQALSNTFIQSVSNIRNITSIVKIADNALGQVERILQRSMMLVQQKNDLLLSESQIDSVNNEITNLLDQITQISDRTIFNGQKVFGSEFTVDSGANTQTTIRIPDLNLLSLGLSGFATNNPSNFETYIPSISDNYTLSQLGSSSNSKFVVDTGYVNFTINGFGKGSLGDGSSSPGLMFDPNGGGSYGVEDYISPGTPFETFVIKAGSNNIVGSNISNSLDNSAAKIWRIDSTKNNYLVLKGSESTGFAQVQYMALPGESVIRMRMSYTNTTGATQNVTMARGLDPDVDVRTYGSYLTINTLGADGIPATDLVNSIGQRSGKALSLYVPGNGYTHNVAIMNPWPVYDPNSILNGDESSDPVNGHDYAIMGAWNIGPVENGKTVSVDAYYIAGTNVLETIDRLSNSSSSNVSIEQISSALNNNFSNRSNLGIQLNILENQIEHLQTSSDGFDMAISRILDVDYAFEVSRLARNQINQDAAAAMLAKANNYPDTLLQLMQRSAYLKN